jgi:lipoate-protein ligase A
MPPDTWRLLIDQPADGAANMARDEAILSCHAGPWPKGRPSSGVTGAAQPTLRLYRWRPACLSLGRFQRAGAVDRAACARAGVPIVRRPSGGRALLHDAELTYAIIVRADYSLFGDQSILATYRQISLALLAGLRRLGVAAELTPARRGDHRPPTTDHRPTTIVSSESTDCQSSVVGGRWSAACFDTSVAYELTVAGRKLAGSAQTRRAGSILQHGAIPLTPHAERLAALLHHPPDDLGTRMIALDQAAGRKIEFDELSDALIAGFRDAWSITFERRALSEREQREEQRLIAEKYTDDRWTYGGIS